MSGSRVQEAKTSSDTIVLEWKHEKSVFELETKAKVTAVMLEHIHSLASPIQSNFWVKLYHSDSCTVGVCCIVFGILLGILIVPIVLVPIGICILASPDQYYDYTFQKMLTFLRTIDFQNDRSLRKFGLKGEFTFSQSS